MRLSDCIASLVFSYITKAKCYLNTDYGDLDIILTTLRSVLNFWIHITLAQILSDPYVWFCPSPKLSLRNV